MKKLFNISTEYSDVLTSITVNGKVDSDKALEISLAEAQDNLKKGRLIAICEDAMGNLFSSLFFIPSVKVMAACEVRLAMIGEQPTKYVDTVFSHNAKNVEQMYKEYTDCMYEDTNDALSVLDDIEKRYTAGEYSEYDDPDYIEYLIKRSRKLIASNRNDPAPRDRSKPFRELTEICNYCRFVFMYRPFW